MQRAAIARKHWGPVAVAAIAKTAIAAIDPAIAQKPSNDGQSLPAAGHLAAIAAIAFRRQSLRAVSDRQRLPATASDRASGIAFRLQQDSGSPLPTCLGPRCLCPKPIQGTVDDDLPPGVRNRTHDATTCG